jgi:hypothetical protein
MMGGVRSRGRDGQYAGNGLRIPHMTSWAFDRFGARLICSDDAYIRRQYENAEDGPGTLQQVFVTFSLMTYQLCRSFLTV